MPLTARQLLVTAWIVGAIALASLAAMGSTVALANVETAPAPCPTAEELLQLTPEQVVELELEACVEALAQQEQPALPTTDTPEQPRPQDPAPPTPPVPPVPPVHEQPTGKSPPSRTSDDRPQRPRPPRPRRDRAERLEAPQGDALTYRERLARPGALPAQPTIAPAHLRMLMRAASGTSTHWSTLVAISWLESGWGRRPGLLAGRMLSDRDWQAYGQDASGDGIVSRTDSADAARALARLLAASGADAYMDAARASVADIHADFYAAVGSRALMYGLDDPRARRHLQRALLKDPRCLLRPEGRLDVADGIVDPRVLVTIRFLGRRFGTVTISSLIRGHGVLTASGGVSLHAHGQAFDVAALDGESVLGSQQPGSRTHRAVRELLLLPDTMRLQELISLWEMGGPAFAAADHADHIHVGFASAGSAA